MNFDEGPFPITQRRNFSDWPSVVTLYSGQPKVPYINNEHNRQDLSALNQGSEIIMARYQEDFERKDAAARRNRQFYNLGANLFGL